jgi:hypothetical protein
VLPRKTETQQYMPGPLRLAKQWGNYAGLQRADVTATGVPATDVPATDVPATAVTATDVPATDVTATDVTATGKLLSLRCILEDVSRDH